VHAASVQYLHLYKRVLEILVLKFSQFIGDTLIILNVGFLFCNIQRYVVDLIFHFFYSLSLVHV
jgi:hypothetical protein